MKRKKSVLNRVVNIAIVAICCYLAASFVTLFMEVSARKSKIEEVKAQCEEQKIRNDELEGMLEQESVREFVVKIAREKLDFIFPDERVYFNASGNK